MGSAQPIVALDPRLVDQLQRRKIGRAARVDRALGADLLAAVEHQRILAHRDHLGAEPVLAAAQRLRDRLVEIGRGEAGPGRFEVAAEAREGDVEAGPALERQRLEQLRVAAELGLRKQPVACCRRSSSPPRRSAPARRGGSRAMASAARQAESPPPAITIPFRRPRAMTPRLYRILRRRAPCPRRRRGSFWDCRAGFRPPIKHKA